MKLRLCVMLWFVAGWAAAADSPVAQPPARTNAPIPALVEMPEWVKTFQLKPGFRLELIASEAVLTDPLAMAFDENGRLFVLEAKDNGGDTQSGRVRMLEDSDTNGVYNVSTVYADNVSSPSALACYGGGVFVGAAGQIIFLKDTKNDGLADARREVFKSFGDATNGNGGKVTITSLQWGLDNRIHAATGGLGGDVISSSAPVQSLILTNGNFSFDPRTFQLAGESGSGSSGMSYDNRGRQFVSSPARHLQMVMYDGASAARNPFYAMPGAVADLAGAGVASLIYPASVQTGVVYASEPAPKRFSAASGVTIYRGSAFPPEYLGDAFVIDAAANVVHRDKLRQNGIELSAERPGDEATTEFLAVRDGSFQLKQVVNGPEGLLYVLGQAREKNAAKAGESRGRIYRIVPLNFKGVKAQQLGTATGEQLALALRHPNGWRRDTAARLLYERQDRTTVIPLIRLLFDAQAPPMGRMHALRALDGLQVTSEGKPGKALMEPHVLRALVDPDDRVREQGVLLAERFITAGGVISDRLWGQLSNMTGDPSPQVRYQLAFALGRTQHAGRVAALTQILRSDPRSPWMQAAVLSSLSEGAGEMFGVAAADASFRSEATGREFLRELVLIIGAKDQPAEARQALLDIRAIPEAQLGFNLAFTLGNSLQSANDSLSQVDTAGTLKPLYERAAKVALDLNADDATRTQGLRVLSAVGSVDPGMSVALLEEWPGLRAGLRSEAAISMLSRGNRTYGFVYEIEMGDISRNELTPAQIKFLWDYQDGKVHQSMLNMFGKNGGNAVSRQPVVSRFRGALQFSGSVERGQRIFDSHCAICHVLGGQGSKIGLSLAEAAKMSKDTLLTKILDPNRDQTFTYPETLIITRDNETLMGFVARQNSKSVTLIQANGVERTVGRSNNQSQTSLGISGMPEGLEAGLTVQDMADLLEFISANAQ